MKVCNIVPTSWLDKVDLYTNKHLILAQEVFKDSRYGDYYRKRCIDGHHIIVDNGAFENECVTQDQVVQAMHKIYVPKCGNVDIVAPEVMGDANASLQLIREFVLFLEQYYITYARLFVVLQGRDIEEAMAFFWEVNAWVGKIRPIVFGVPKYFDEHRPLLLKELIKKTGNPIHLLGLCNSGADRRNPRSKLIESLDTSYAATIAMNGLPPIPVDGGLRSPKRMTGFFQACPPTPMQERTYAIAHDWLCDQLDAE